MTDHDDKLKRAWRALAKEEPPAALDAAILAAARRSVARPSFARRWAMPVSIAAVLMLAIGVTLEMQHERPGVELAAPEAKRVAPSPLGEGRGEGPPSAAASAETRHDRRAQSFAQRSAPAPAAAPPAAPPPAPAASPSAPAEAPTAPPVAAQLAPQPKATAKRESAASAAAVATAKVQHDPHAELERIAKLRAEGRDEEADRALEEFRKRFPDYRIDDATWAKVKPR
jgi:hypothetical protein